MKSAELHIVTSKKINLKAVEFWRCRNVMKRCSGLKQLRTRFVSQNYSITVAIGRESVNWQVQPLHQSTADHLFLYVDIQEWNVNMYRGADKSLVRPGRKQAAPVKSVMGRGMD